jgi:hypothetical protein
MSSIMVVFLFSNSIIVCRNVFGDVEKLAEGVWGFVRILKYVEQAFHSLFEFEHKRPGQLSNTGHFASGGGGVLPLFILL